MKPLILIGSLLLLNACTTLQIEKRGQGFVIKYNTPESEKVIEIKYKFMKTLWEETQKVSGIYRDQFPKINFIDFDPEEKNSTKKGVRGRTHYKAGDCNKIDIHYGDILIDSPYYNQLETEISLHNTIGHEYLHCLYRHKGIMHEKENHHCRMIQTGDLEKLTTFINKELGGENNDPQNKSLDSAESDCEKWR